MDFSGYSKEIQELHREHQECLRRGGVDAPRVLQRMLRLAKAQGDDELIGYVYHATAFAEYFFLGRYDGFLKNLKLSAHHLLRCRNSAEMLHVYFLIGIDAMNKGMLDMAHHYYLAARNIAEEVGNRTSAAILDENIGNILLQLGEYAESRKYTKRAQEGIRKDKEHSHYYNNMITAYLNDGMACLALGKVAQARKDYEKTAAFMKGEPEGRHSDTRLDFALFGTRLAIAEGDEEEEKKCFQRALPLIGEVTQIALYIDEINKICQVMLSRGDKRPVGRMLRALEKRTLSAEAANAQRILTDLRADYYTASGQGRALQEAFAEQDRAYARLQAEQKQIYRLAKELVQLTGDLQREREAAAEKQTELLRLARTDALTGIPNRLAGGIQLDEVYERTWASREKLGVVFLDLDDLKTVNDTRGHAAGDALLIEIGAALMARGKEDGFFAARYGGDEFVIIFENASDAYIDACLRRLRKDCDVRFSAGKYNSVPAPGEKSWQYLVRADRAMYQEKRKKNKRQAQSVEGEKR